MKASFYDEEYFDGGKGYSEYKYNNTYSLIAEDIAIRFNPKSTLEIGCAKGFVVKELRERGIDASGIDLSEYAIANAHPHVYEYVHLYDINKADKIPFDKVDLVYSLDTFEHIPEEQLDKVWEFMKKIGKRYYVKVGTLNTPDWQHDPSHITMHTLKWWQKRYPEIIFEESK